ncbi:hypothetical protein HYPSUDRAFT_31556 [Hypholoma sublateritium FD-334 SS-4]|uniref:Uncharacterized protein n=1 Tax=Hypholoma sublateritium (strain FD-334 SS-4) TaxID=945553 RepID=A0A0D2LNH0_HYPSF|nr:hypothetical protein HYPSUDRAFT_31556 [Hypholoma sublateritium FD-334 SS-4]
MTERRYPSPRMSAEVSQEVVENYPASNPISMSTFYNEHSGFGPPAYIIICIVITCFSASASDR